MHHAQMEQNFTVEILQANNLSSNLTMSSWQIFNWKSCLLNGAEPRELREGQLKVYFNKKSILKKDIHA